MSYEKQLGPKKMLLSVAAEYPALTRDPHLDVAAIWREEVERVARALDTMIWVEFNAGVGPGRRLVLSAARSMSNFYAQALADLDRKQHGRGVLSAPVLWIDDVDSRRAYSATLPPGAVPWSNGWDPLRELTAWLRRARALAWTARGPVAAYGSLARMKGRSALIVIVLGREIVAIERAVERLESRTG